MTGSWKEIKPKTSKDLVFESNPSYHFSMSCELLNKDYENFYIPKEILEKGDGKINEFKKWFKSTKHLLDGKVDVFEYRWHNKWNFHVNVKKIYIENSGVSIFENQSVKQIETEIDFLLKAAQDLTVNYPAIIKKYGKFAKESLSRKTYTKNDTGFSDLEIREVLLKLEIEIKDPLRRLLVNWYRTKQNPELNFDAKILDQLGFKSCPVCSSKIKTEKYVVESQDTTELLFNELRKLRYEISKGSPAYLVFSDKTLREISLKAPTTLDEFARINGVGPVKVDSFGKIFIDFIKAFKFKKGRGEKSVSTLGQI
jgi:superfamily II DNA helicase RecQ